MEITYYIKIPSDNIEAFNNAIKELGIDFDTIDNMQYIDYEDSKPDLPIRTGSEIPKLITSINEYLKQKYIHTHIPTNYKNWDLEKIYNFLKLATKEFEWEDGNILHSFRALSYSSWPYIANEYSIDLINYQ